jgi:hypothetical protein
MADIVRGVAAEAFLAIIEKLSCENMNMCDRRILGT